eukprot:1168706-Rhodomonas_salina.1
MARICYISVKHPLNDAAIAPSFNQPLIRRIFLPFFKYKQPITIFPQRQPKRMVAETPRKAASYLRKTHLHSCHEEFKEDIIAHSGAGGYSQEDNLWLKESNLGNAPEVLAAYHACQDEMKSWEALQVYTLVNEDELRKLGVEIIDSKVVFKVKVDKYSNPYRHKCRIVARGFQESNQGETFAPMAHPVTIRTMIAIAEANGWYMKQGDVKTAYLNAKLEKPVSDDGDLKYYLGVHYTRDCGYVIANQTGYLQRVLKRYWMDKCK